MNGGFSSGASGRGAGGGMDTGHRIPDSRSLTHADAGNTTTDDKNRANFERPVRASYRRVTGDNPPISAAAASVVH